MTRYLQPSLLFHSLLLAASAAIAVRAQGPGYVLSTIAGQALLGSGDGPAGTAGFASPRAVAVDQSGNVYVADSYNHTIRKITPTGMVSTLAGQVGNPGSADGTGTAAQFAFPNGLAIDQLGNIYVSDGQNQTIRRITPSGVVSTLAGQPGVVGSADGTGSAARFNFPMSVAVDCTGNVYVADSLNATVRKITPGGAVTTLAGQAGNTGSTDGAGNSARFVEPAGVAVDGAGDVYVSDLGSDTIRKITTAGVVSTLAGKAGAVAGSADGLGSAAQFRFPSGLAVDKDGNVYVADNFNDTIRKITPAGNVTTLAGLAQQPGAADGAGGAARFDSPNSVAVDEAGNIYVADTGSALIRTVTPAGMVTTLAGKTGSEGSADGAGDAARFSYPEGVAVDQTGNIYVSDSGNHTIRKVTSAGVVTTLAGAAGQAGSADGQGSTARFNFPDGLAVDGAGNVYVADEENFTIRRVTPAGVVSTIAGHAGDWGDANGLGGAARFTQPTGLTIDRQANIYVSDRGTHTIRKIAPNGMVSTLAGQSGVAGTADGTGSAARFSSPEGLAVDAQGNVYVSDDTSTIRKITPDGVVSTVAGKFGNHAHVDGTAGDARFFLSGGIAVDRLGTIYVSDGHNTIRQISPTGLVTTLAGRADAYGGVDGVDSAARFFFPGGLAVDESGDLFVADSANNTIRKGTPAPSSAAAVSSEPASQFPTAGGVMVFAITMNASPTPTFQWQFNGTDLAGATASKLRLVNLQPTDTGLYGAVVSSGSASTNPIAILGLSSANKVLGSGTEILSDQFVAFNNNTFDQVALQGAAATITADPGQITRMSFLDMNDDIVQVEFSGAGALSLRLEGSSGPVAPANYNQPGVTYMKGNAGIVIVGADETTNVSIFSVGTLTAANQTLFKSGVNYDGVADIAFIAIQSANGKFGGVRTANASYSATKGFAGIYAPGVTFTGPIYVGDISAAGEAMPVMLLGSALGDTRITGGDLFQANGQPVKVSGITKLEFTDGTTSNNAHLPAQTNKGQLQPGGTELAIQ